MAELAKIGNEGSTYSIKKGTSLLDFAPRLKLAHEPLLVKIDGQIVSLETLVEKDTISCAYQWRRMDNVWSINSPMDRQRVIVLISGLGLVLVSVIAWWSIPKWGAVKGALAYTSGTLSGFVVYSILTYLLLRIRYPFSWVKKVMLGSTVMGGMTWFLLQYINFLVVSFFIAPAVYTGVLILIRTFSPNDHMILRQIAPDFIAKLLTAKTQA